MQLPEGSVELTPDEAATAIATGDHPETAAGSVEQDVVMIEMIRDGLIDTCRLPDGRLGFSATQKLIDQEAERRG